MANQAFTSYGFQAAGAPTDRNMPTRLNDVINVKDFGALGDGTTDDTAAIQAAIDYAYTFTPDSVFRHGTIVFIPPGTYRIDSGQLKLYNYAESFGGGSYSLSLEGCGMDVSILRGDYADGFLVEKLSTGFSTSAQFGNLRNLTIWNESQVSGSGAFLMESCGSINTFSNVHFCGLSGFWWLHDVYPCSVVSCKFTCSVPPNRADAAAVWPPRNSVGLWVPQGEIVSCRIEGFDTGIAQLPYGYVTGCQISRCNHGIYGGKANVLFTQNELIIGSTDQSNIIDRCRVGLYCANVSGLNFNGNIIKGIDGVRDAAPMTLSWSSDVVTATVSGGHNLQVNEVQSLTITPEATGGTYSLSLGGDLVVVAYNSDAATVQAALETLSSIGPGDVACTGGPFPWPIYIEFTGTLAAASQSLITTVDSITNGAPTIARVRGGGTTASLLLVTSPAAWTPDGTGTQIVTCTRTSATQFTYARTGNPGSFTSATWNYPLTHAISFRIGSVNLFACNILNAFVSTAGIDLVGPTSASGTQFKNILMCTSASYGSTPWIPPADQAKAGWTLINCNTGVFAMPYASLPGGVGVGEGRATEGMEHTITNGNPSSAAFGATISASGTNRYKVRYDSVNWVRVG